MTDYSAEGVNRRLPYAFGGDLEWIKITARQLPSAAIVVMLGAGPGVMALAVLEERSDLQKFLIVDNTDYSTCQAHIKAAKLTNAQTSFMLGTSWEVPQIFTNKVDFLIVDADHSYTGVYQDICAWAPSLKVGSKVFFHDVIDMELNGTNGVLRAINQALDEGSFKARLLVSPGISQIYEVTA